MTLTREERETIVRTSEADDTWEVYTDSRAMAARLRKRGWQPLPGGDGRTFRLPLKAITIRSREGMESLKAAAATRMPSLPHLRLKGQAN
jgi:hypothetical protein